MLASCQTNSYASSIQYQLPDILNEDCLLFLRLRLHFCYQFTLTPCSKCKYSGRLLLYILALQIDTFNAITVPPSRSLTTEWR
jgi:hypothetical protein